MIKTLKYLDKKDWLFVFLSLVFVFGTVYFELEIPGYMAKITTLVQTEGSVMNDVWSAGGMMLLSALGSLICAIICLLAGKPEYLNQAWGYLIAYEDDIAKADSLADLLAAGAVEQTR